MLLKNLLREVVSGHVYHITPKKNIPSMQKTGILPYPKKPGRFVEKAIYLFNNRITAEDAIMNWLGDKFPEDEPLVILTINPHGLKIVSSDVGYELRTFEPIPWESVVNVEDI